MANNQDDIRRKAQETASIVEDALRGIAGQIGDIFEQALSGADRVTRATSRDLQASFNKFARITDDIASNIIKIEQGSLTVKNIQQQINQRKAQELSLGIKLVTNLRQQGVQVENIEELIEKQNAGTLSLTKKQKKLVEEYAKAQGYNADYTKELEKQQKLVEAQNQKLGITGKLAKGISKIPVFGDLIDGEKVADAAREESARKGSTKFSVMAKTAGAVGKSLAGSLTDPLFIITQIFGLLTSMDKAVGELAKGMNMTYHEALAFREQLSQIAVDSNDTSLNTRKLQESYMAIGESLGANADINEKDLKTFTKLREQAGYTNEELTSMYKMSLVTGKSVEDTTKEFLGGAAAMSAQKGLAINVKQLMKETAGASNTIKLSLGGSSKALAEAAVAAKALGSDLGKVEAISGKLLNFEDSISAELEAELLTGKQINLETARLAALNGDMATVAEEIKNQMGGSAEFTKMNRIQQEAFANAVGMSREELANSLVEQEALQRVGAKTAEEARKKYDDLRSRGLSAEQAALQLGDAQLAKQFEQQSASEKFNQSIEKLKDLFTNLLEGPFGKLLEGFAAFVSDADTVYAIFGAISGLIAGKMVAGMVQMIAKLGVALGLSTARAAAEVTAAEAFTMGAATIGIIAGLGMVMAAMSSASEPKVPIKDGMISPDGGLLVSGAKGTFQLDKQDTVIAGTDLNKNKGGGGGGSQPIDYDRLAAAMSRVNINTSVKVNDREIANASNTGNVTGPGKLQ